MSKLEPNACCLLCHEPFRLWNKFQRWHTCEAAKNLRYEEERRLKAESWQRRGKYRLAQNLQRLSDLREKAELKKGRHKCPDCGEVYTFNKYRCDGCWERLAAYQDLDALLVYGAGERNRRHLQTVVHLSEKYI